MKDRSNSSTLEMAAINHGDLAAADVASLAMVVVSGMDPADVLERTTDFLARRLEATECSCLAVDTSATGSSLIYAADAHQPELRGRRLSEQSLSYETQAIIERSAEWSGGYEGIKDPADSYDEETESQPPPVLRGTLTETDARPASGGAGLIVPLIQAYRTIGVLWVGRRLNGDPYTQWEVALVQCAGALNAQALGVLLSERAQLQADRERKLEQQRQFDKLELTIAKLRNVIESRKTDLSICAHDMRAPIGVIQGHSHTIRGLTGGDAVVSKSLDAIERQTKRLLSMVEDVLGDERQRALNLKLEPWDLVSLVTSWAEDYRMLAERDLVQLDVDIAPDLGIRRVDADKLDEVLTNIVDNAIKFSTTRGVVRFAVDMADDDRLRFRITDSGPGLSKREVDNGFEMFFRGNQDGPVGGTGVGLASVGHNLKLLGGRVEIRNHEEGGAEFTVIVPTYRDDLASDDTNPLPSRIFRVLLIDADPTSLDRAAQSLSMQFEVLTAKNEREAQWVLQRTPIDCAIVDVHAPLMTGFATGSELRRDPTRRHLPVLYTSVAEVSNSLVRRHGESPENVIRKPVPPDVLADRVSEAISASLERITEESGERIDPLTGLATGVQARGEVERQLAISRSRRSYLSLVVVGLDRAERVVSQSGSGALEELVKECSDALSQLTLGKELVTRWGLLEFLCILPNTSTAAAKILADRAHKKLSNDVVGMVNVTVSIGVTSVSARDEIDVEQLIFNAQAALNDARTAGGDCVVVWRRPSDHDSSQIPLPK